MATSHSMNLAMDPYSARHALLDPYVANNEVLPENLTPTWVHHLEQLSKMLEPLNNEIKELEQAILLVKHKRDLLCKERETFRLIQSPIRRLPAELVALIMRFVIQGTPRKQHFVLNSVTSIQCHRPVQELLRGASRHGGSTGVCQRLKTFARLRAVCRSWRRTAVSVPDLWRGNTINLNTRDRSKDLSGPLNTWFTPASHRCPMEFVVSDNDVGRVTNATFQSIVQFITDSPINWTTLGFEGSILSTGDRVNKLLYPAAPWNTVLNLTLHTAIVDRGNHWNALFTSTPTKPALDELSIAFPRLESLSLTGTFTMQNAIGIPFSHPNLVSLRLSSATGSIRHFASFLNGLPRLEELVLMPMLDTFPTPLFEAQPLDLNFQTAHPSLQRLVLIGASSLHLEVISAFTLPELTFLKLDDPCYSEDHSMLLGDFIRRCDPTHLTVAAHHTVSTEPEDILSNLPIVHRLFVRNFTFLEEVTYPTDGPASIPDSLEEIVCSSPVSSCFDFLGWANDVRGNFTRQRGRTIKIYAPHSYSLERDRNTVRYMEEGTRLLRDAGLELEWLPEANIMAMLEYPMRGHTYHES